MPTLPQTLFEQSRPGKKAYNLPSSCKEFEKYQPSSRLIRKKQLQFPEVSELEIIRHFNQLAHCNVGVENVFYPLGSCTMKYNPRVSELCASISQFQKIHPFSSSENLQGSFHIMSKLLKDLCQLTGMSDGTLLPNAGAQGEFTALRMIQAYHESRGEGDRNEILIPTHAHGTNFASAHMAGYRVVTIKLNVQGDIDLDHLQTLLSAKTAALMLTNPSTLGLFSKNICKITECIHQAGGLCYYDGANFNAIVGKVQAVSMGFDILHLNLHKTFATPHGGGGPGSGPVLCKKELTPFLPLPKIYKSDESYKISWESSQSIGFIASFYGNFTVYLKAYLYLLLLGRYGLYKVAENAVLNANYLKSQIEKILKVPFKGRCMHEFVVQGDQFLGKGIRALDIAKRFLDYGVYAPTIYFPLMVKEAMLIESTETESKQTLDRFIEIIKKIVEEIEKEPDFVKAAPHTTPVKRLDEINAGRHPKLKFL